MAELGVELILANSPQAEGRVERMNGTLRDRLVKEMTPRGVGDVASANALLAGGFPGGLNARCAVAAKRRRPDLHRRVAAGAGLEDVLCVHEEGAVARDWCVQRRGRLLQVDTRHAALDLPRPGRRVRVVERLGGTLLLRYGGETLGWREVSDRPAKPKPKPARTAAVASNKRWEPAADHPFRRGPGGGAESLTALLRREPPAILLRQDSQPIHATSRQSYIYTH